MIGPVIAITILSIIISLVLNLLTFGLASLILEPAIPIFFTLFGIRVALSAMGEHTRPSYGILALYSVIYGLIMVFAKGTVLTISGLVGVAYGEWQMEDAISIRTFAEAADPLQTAFVLHTLSATTILSFVLYCVVHAVIAVPMAGAARSAGHNANSSSFMDGFGRAFVPLFCIFAVVFFLQFFFEFFALLFAIFPLLIEVLSFLITLSVPDIDLIVVLKGLAAAAGLLWFNSWMWAASALALRQTDEKQHRKRKVEKQPVATTTDIRKLRKSRE
ncbi:MAG: hypothetical protein AAFQ66_02610 [Pseudomonadota bacterium]